MPKQGQLNTHNNGGIMKKIHFFCISACACYALLTTGLHTASAGNTIPMAHAPAQGRIGKIPNIPGIKKLPDLKITRIYTKKHMGEQGIWADIKNIGRSIPTKEFNQADMRFYLSYINTGSPTTGPVKGRKDNGYSFKYLEQKGAGILSKAGGTMSVIAPGNLTCHGTVQVRVEVDLPVSSGGRIKESNEHNNVKTAILHCP